VTTVPAAVARYPLDRLYEEVAFVAYHFNWAHADVLALPHWERRRWCEEISRINERMNEESGRASTHASGAPRTRDVPLREVD
jgi:hypothetical protein